MNSPIIRRTLPHPDVVAPACTAFGRAAHQGERAAIAAVLDAADQEPNTIAFRVISKAKPKGAA